MVGAGGTVGAGKGLVGTFFSLSSWTVTEYCRLYKDTFGQKQLLAKRFQSVTAPADSYLGLAGKSPGTAAEFSV